MTHEDRDRQYLETFVAGLVFYQCRFSLKINPDDDIISDVCRDLHDSHVGFAILRRNRRIRVFFFTSWVDTIRRDVIFVLYRSYHTRDLSSMIT